MSASKIDNPRAVASKRMTDTAASSPGSAKRANFSLAVTNPNGVSKMSPGVGAVNKPGTAKKLIIKNFKGEPIIHLPIILEKLLTLKCIELIN